ncbi:DNA adenine methylase, partial [bacterium]|nr:DNA adenine methylase [bacterium]
MKTLWYMGVKTRLIDGFIDRAVSEAAVEGSTLLDIFSGTAAVGTALASRYRIVANDVQRYAAAVARAYLVHDERTKESFLASLDPERDLGAAFNENYKVLAGALSDALAVEDDFLRDAGLEPGALTDGESPLEGTERETDHRGGAEDSELPQRNSKKSSSADLCATLSASAVPVVFRQSLEAAYRKFALESTPWFEEARAASFTGPFARARELLSREAVLARRKKPASFPYILCSSYYPNVYLGVRQAIVTDSLRYAIDRMDPGDPLLASKRAHYLAALLHALSVTTSATSHFCQPRGLTRDCEVHAILARRAPSIASRTIAFSKEIAAIVADTRFHEGNAVFSGDWRALFRPTGRGAQAFREREARADVVYIDPPYTSDNYSRFYHLLEVVSDYDYPPLDVRRGAATKGRYPSRERRHQSAFCRRATVESELRDLLETCARAGAAAVVSYSRESGLLLRRYREDDGLSGARALERFQDLA